MKICIPIDTPQHGGGGGFYFLEHFRRYLTEHGIEHTRDLDAAFDILFLNSWHVTPYNVMRAWRRNPEARLVHRIDGVAQNYGRTDLFRTDDIVRRVNRFADRTVFQSAYSRHTSYEKFLVVSQDGPVIWNPVDITTFTADGSRRNLPGKVNVCYASFSTNRMKGGSQLYEVAAEHREIDFILCGHFDSPPDFPNVHFMGHLGREPLAEVMRSCDVFLIFARNEACPNVVLEAMASGLPVLYLASGGTSELVRSAGLPVSVETFKMQLDALFARRVEYSAQARNYALTDFHPDTVFPKYMEIMHQALSEPPRVPLRQRRLLALTSYASEPAALFWNWTRPFRGRVIQKLRSMRGRSSK